MKLSSQTQKENGKAGYTVRPCLGKKKFKKQKPRWVSDLRTPIVFIDRYSAAASSVGGTGLPSITAPRRLRQGDPHEYQVILGYVNSCDAMTWSSSALHCQTFPHGHPVGFSSSKVYLGKLIFNLCVCVCLHVCLYNMCGAQRLQRPEEGSRSPGIGVTGHCKLPDGSAGN